MSNLMNSQPQSRPWWAYGHVWLVIAGPLVVVFASFITFYLAANGQDPVLTRSSEEMTSSDANASSALAPAMQARNHSATGILPSANTPTKP